MATITRTSKSSVAEYQVWDHTELAVGEILDVFASLGNRPARSVTITCIGGEGQVSFNVVESVYKSQEAVGNTFIPDAAFWPSPALITEIEVTKPVITVLADTSEKCSEFGVMTIKIYQIAPVMYITVA